MKLIQVAILSRALKKTDISLRDSQQIMEEVGEAHKTISTVFSEFESFSVAEVEGRAVTRSTPRSLPAAAKHKTVPTGNAHSNNKVAA